MVVCILLYKGALAATTSTYGAVNEVEFAIDDGEEVELAKDDEESTAHV
jgi:hypothetical protein